MKRLIGTQPLLTLQSNKQKTTYHGEYSSEGRPLFGSATVLTFIYIFHEKLDFSSEKTVTYIILF